MDTPTAAKAAKLFRDWELYGLALSALEAGTPIIFYTELTANRPFTMPENLRGDLIRHFRKLKEAVTAEIEAL